MTLSPTAIILKPKDSNKNNNQDIKNNFKLEKVACNVSNIFLQREQLQQELPVKRHGNSCINQKLLLTNRYSKSAEGVEEVLAGGQRNFEKQIIANKVEMGRREIKRSNTTGSTGRPQESGSGK